jgi:hypothetical protein
MPFRTVHFACLKRIGDPPGKVYWCLLQWLALTLAVVSGPLIAMVPRLAQSPDATQGGFSMAQAIRGLLCALMLLSLFFSRGLHRLQHRLVRPLLFLALYALASWPVAYYPYHNMVFAVRMVFLALIFACAFHLAEEGLARQRWLQMCAWVILLTMGAIIGVGLVTGQTIRAYGSRYATAGGIDSSFVASFLLLSTLPVFVGLAVEKRSAVAGIVLLFASLFFVMCRSALIAATAAVGSFFLINLRDRGRRIPWRNTLVPVGVLLLLAGVGLSTRPGVDLRARFRDLNPCEGTGSGRYQFWVVSLEQIIDRPVGAQLLGEGMGRIKDVLEQNFWGHFISSHSDWLDFASAFGLFGLAGLSWWYFELARFAWGLHHRIDGPFQGACACLVILGLISTGTGGFYSPAWALSFMTLGFWAGRAAPAQPPGDIPAEAQPVEENGHARCPVH